MNKSEPGAKVPAGFSREQRVEAYPPGAGAHAWFQGRNRILDGKLPERARRGVVLDNGRRPDITVAHLRSKNVACHGCELARRSCRERLLLPLRPIDALLRVG